LQHAVSKSFHLSSSSLNGFIRAGAAERLIYHNSKGITACQENLSNGVFGSRRRPGSGRRPVVNHRQSPIPSRQLSGMTIAIALNRNNDIEAAVVELNAQTPAVPIWRLLDVLC
jgi:hypothetical protein